MLRNFPMDVGLISMTFTFTQSMRSCCVAILAFAASQANAQIVSPQLGNDVIVTATKTEQFAADLPFSLSVLDGEGLSRLDSAEEITQSLAGVQAAVANGNQIVFQIRGIGAVDHQALTPTAAAVYVDGVFQATNVQTGPLLFDLERAEVLKGPQGSLYGRNATAGAINFISKRPDDESEGYVSAELGNFEHVNLNAAANLPVHEDFALRLSGRYLSQSALIDNVVTQEGVAAPSEAGGERDEFGLRALGLWTPSDDTQLLLNLHYAEDNGINPSARNEGLDLNDHEISVGPSGVQDTDNEFYGASIEINHDFGSFELTSLTAFEEYNQQYGFDFGGLQDFSVSVPSLSGNANLSYDRDFTQFSQELRASRSGEKYESLVGLYLEDEDFDQDYRVWCGVLDLETLQGSCNYIAADRRVGAADRPAGATGNALQSLISQERQTAALFTHNNYHLTPKLDLIWGARLTYEEIEGSGEGRHIFDDAAATVGLNNQFETDGTGADVTVGPAIGRNEITDTRFSGNVGLTYALTQKAKAYANYANGFKSGGFNGEVINNASHFDDAGLFEAETVDNFEIGVKLSDDIYSLNIAAFYADYDNPQARFFETVTLENGEQVGLNSLSNFEAAKSAGIELEGQLSPRPHFNLFAALTLLDTEIEDAERPALDGDELPFASDTSLVLGADYNLLMQDGVTMGLAASSKYVSDFTTGADEQSASAFIQDSYWTVDASLTLGLPTGPEIGFWGRNLTDSDYATSAFRFFGATTFRGAPRTYGVRLKYSY